MDNLKDLTLGKVLENSAAESPDKVAIVDGDRRTTYAELNATADALAAGLAGLGLEKGDRVAIYMKNSLELVTAFYALQKIGVVVVWINALYRVHEAEFILKNSEARGLFIVDQWDGYDYVAEILKLKSNLPELEHIVVAGNRRSANWPSAVGKRLTTTRKSRAANACCHNAGFGQVVISEAPLTMRARMG
jgi:non-ribosomal peptide synthetase component E (peptide arylation enzyme)